jgi:predicted transglutaminase-like cysteine proteinase
MLRASQNAGRIVATFYFVILTTAAWADPSSMIIGRLTSQPIGHFEFCKRYPAECLVKPAEQALLPISRNLLGKLAAVTAEVNKAVRPVRDADLYGKDEFWTYPDGAGDCEEYVLAKQRILRDTGMSPANLLITVVRKPDGEGHAILTVRTDGGDYVLDNLNRDVKPWDETGYTFLKRQASNDLGHWVTIEQGHGEPLVSAVR